MFNWSGELTGFARNSCYSRMGMECIVAWFPWNETKSLDLRGMGQIVRDHRRNVTIHLTFTVLLLL